MYKQLKRGLFITFEGGEGLGKSTQAALLADRLREEYVGVLTTREPGGTDLGKKLRELLLHGTEPLAKPTELLLMMADRAEHVAKLIRPALDEGQVVVCDRFVDSTIAYQGWGRGHDTGTLWALHAIAADNLLPDLTFVMEGTPHRDRGDDRFEALGDNFHERVRRGYAHMVHNPLYGESFRQRERLRPIAANREPDTIAKEIFSIVAPFLVQRL